MVRLAILSLLLACLTGCGVSSTPPQTLTLATTTSTRDSGLLDKLLPAFEAQAGLQVKVLAVGSGQALELGRRGDADVLLTHAPTGEQTLVREGFAEERIPIMYNDFVLVGPKEDPAHVSEQKSILSALSTIATNQSPFVSRGDDSGTHRKEQALWLEANIDPLGDWYIQSGSGMAATLRIANEKDAYTLSDRATFLAQQKRLNLQVHFAGDSRLMNPYAVLVIDPHKHPHTNHAGGTAFANFLQTDTARQIISSFGREHYGQPLFFLMDEAQTANNHSNSDAKQW